MYEITSDTFVLLDCDCVIAIFIIIFSPFSIPFSESNHMWKWREWCLIERPYVIFNFGQNVIVHNGRRGGWIEWKLNYKWKLFVVSRGVIWNVHFPVAVTCTFHSIMRLLEFSCIGGSLGHRVISQMKMAFYLKRKYTVFTCLSN